jgi:type I restriction enzyme S subunit
VIPESLSESNCADLVVVTPSKELNPFYLAAIFNSEWGKAKVAGNLVGVAQQHFNITVARELEIFLPSRPMQDRIAEIFLAYENLIENNRRRIRILEETARALYREWFVYFRYPSHESVPLVDSSLGFIPKGWEVKSVGELLQRLPTGNKYTQENTDQEGAVPVIDQSEKEILGFHNNEADHKASMQRPIIIFGDHTCKMKIMIKPFSVGPNTIAFTGINLPESFLYFLIRSLIQTQEYKRHWNELIGKKVVIPKMEIAKKFSDFVTPLLEQTTILNYQISNLSKTRDLLLPRLLSGQISLDKKVPVA